LGGSVGGCRLQDQLRAGIRNGGSERIILVKEWEVAEKIAARKFGVARTIESATGASGKAVSRSSNAVPLGKGGRNGECSKNKGCDHGEGEAAGHRRLEPFYAGFAADERWPDWLAEGLPGGAMARKIQTNALE